MAVIEVSEPKYKSEHLVGIEFDIPWGLRRYFSETELELGYEFDVTEIPKSIFSIPALTLICPVAWALGANVYAGHVDKECVENLDEVRDGLETLYPDVFNLDSELHATPIESKPKSTDRSALLFSGGVDSTTAFYRRRDEDLTLINILQKRDSEQKKERQTNYISTFSKAKGIDSTEIYTNAHSVPSKKLMLDFRKKLARDWWNAVHYGIYYNAVCAPFAFRYGVSNLYQASSYTSNRTLPEAQPFVVESLTWSGTTCEITEPNMKRHEKIEMISDFVSENSEISISSCYDRSQRQNCMDCEKCFRTALGAAAVGVSPGSIGFNVTESTISNMKKYLQKHEFTGFHAHMWSEIQERVDPADFAIEDKELMEMFLSATIEPDEAGREFTPSLKEELYFLLPFPIDYFASELYDRRSGQ